MRVVLDTNILTRAARPGTSGPAFQVLQSLLSADHVLCSSPFILDELSRVLRYPRLQTLHGLSDDEIDNFVLAIQAASLVVPLDERLMSEVVLSDPQDDPIVFTAIQSEASVICTLDRHLYQASVLDFCSKHGISVLSDVDLLERLRALEPNQ